jgi:RNA polymerase sigma-70 factor (ECF subfamily)
MHDATANPAILSSAGDLARSSAVASPTTLPAEPTDEQVMQALREGSEPAFDALFRRYKQPIFGFFSRRLSDSARAEELSQETFIALFRAAKRYEARASFRTYLYAIAFRILRADRRKSIFRAAFLGSPKAAASASTPSHADELLWIRRALAKLDSTDCEIVMLREYQQLTYDEIATLLEVPLNTVRSRLFRARNALRDLLIPPPPLPASRPAEQLGSAEKGKRQ